MKQAFYDAIITNIIDETNSTKRFFFKVPNMERFEFKAGQFVMIDLPIDSKIKYRSYSIASAPANDNSFELVIVLNPTGKGTPYMWQNFVTGMKVQIAGPIGKFVLPQMVSNDLCFISTGTGIAPLRAMVWDIFNQKKEHQNLYFIFGCRTPQDLLYHQEMLDMQKQYPQFKYIPVLSRGTPENWDGKIGYVHQVYEEIFSDKRPAQFFLCGWTAMLKEARERIAAMGYGKENIKFEIYD